MSRRSWIKLHVREWLKGPLREEKPEVRGIYADLLALAGDGDTPEGTISIDETRSYSGARIARILNIDGKTWSRVRDRLCALGYIKMDSQTGILYISNWKAHQSEYLRQKPYRSDEGISKTAPKSYKPECNQSYKQSYKQSYTPEVEVEVEVEKNLTPYSPPCSSKTDELVTDPLSLKEEQKPTKKKTKPPRKKTNPEEDPNFLGFWVIYPRQTRKKEAAQAWQARMNEGIDPAVLIEAARTYAAKTKADRTEERFIMQPGTFLGPNTRYLDYVEGEEKGGSSKVDQLEEQEADRVERSRHETADTEVVAGGLEPFDSIVGRMKPAGAIKGMA